jgi:hypothetical protein
VRPAPSLRILFSSPTLRVPGILQSHFLDRIGGSNRIRESVRGALADGSRGVTAKIRWLPHAVADLDESADEGRPRWIHCTPLLGQNGTVGIWMIVLVDEEKHGAPARRFRQAPPVAQDVRGQYSSNQRPMRLDSYDVDLEMHKANGFGSQSSAYGSQSSGHAPQSNNYAPQLNNYALQSNGNNVQSNGYNAQSNGYAHSTYDPRQQGSPRQPQTPRIMVGDQRTLRSTNSSLKDYRNGYAASTDSFNI